MPTYIVKNSQNQIAVEGHDICFSRLSSRYLKPQSITLLFTRDDYNGCATFGDEPDPLDWTILTDSLEELGFGRWLGDVDIEWWEKSRERNGLACYGQAHFNSNVPVPIAVAMMTVMRMRGEGRGYVFRRGVEWGFCPRMSVFLDELYRYNPRNQDYYRYIQVDHGLLRSSFKGLKGLLYFLEWEKHANLEGGMEQHPTYYGREDLLTGVRKQVVDAPAPKSVLMAQRTGLTEQNLHELFQKLEKEVKDAKHRS